MPAFEERWDKAVRFDRTETAELANEKLREENRYTDDEDHQEIRNLWRKFIQLIVISANDIFRAYKEGATAITKGPDKKKIWTQKLREKQEASLQMRKAPHVPQTDSVIETRKDKLHWVAPISSRHQLSCGIGWCVG